MKWLDQQPERSVIYAAFGSVTNFNKTQFQEVALALELSNMPFLWAVRPNSVVDRVNEEAYPYPPGFLDRVGRRGKIVECALIRRFLLILLLLFLLPIVVGIPQSKGYTAAFLSCAGLSLLISSLTRAMFVDEMIEVSLNLINGLKFEH